MLTLPFCDEVEGGGDITGGVEGDEADHTRRSVLRSHALLLYHLQSTLLLQLLSAEEARRP